MIESVYWKKELLDFAKSLKNQKEIKRWSEKAQVLFEKEIILKFFIIRKLTEAKKISDSLKQKKYRIKAFKKNSTKLTEINYFDIYELYDSEKFELKSKDIKFICNQLIHSLTIFAFRENKKWNSVLMCSDLEKNKYIYEIDIKTIIEILTDFGNNYPDSFSYSYNENKGDYDVKIE
jgi:phosphoenolpyruvate-protein kinase (PTS system EI component)